MDEKKTTRIFWCPLPLNIAIAFEHKGAMMSLRKMAGVIMAVGGLVQAPSSWIQNFFHMATEPA